MRVWILGLWGIVSASCAAPPAEPKLGRDGRETATPMETSSPAARAPAGPSTAELDALDPVEPATMRVTLTALGEEFSREPVNASCEEAPPASPTSPECDTQGAALGLLRRAVLAEAAVPTADGSRCGSAWSSERAASALRRAFFARDAVSKRRLDAALAALEGCKGLEPGLVRLVRAMLFPECATRRAAAIADPALPAPLVVALAGTAGRAALLGRPLALPGYRTGFLEREVNAYVTQRLLPWVRAEQVAIATASRRAELLPARSYGRAALTLAVSTRLAELRAAVLVRDLERPGARLRWTELTGPVAAELQREHSAIADSAAAATLIVSDTTLVMPWWSAQGGGMAGSVKDLILPALPVPFDAAVEDTRFWAVLPSYIASRLVPPGLVDAKTLRALSAAGLDPSLRRRLVETAALEPGVAAVAANARLLLAVGAFAPRQAAEAERILGAFESPTPEDRSRQALAHVLAGAPEGPAAWTDALDLPRVDVLLRAAVAASDSPTQQLLLRFDALLLSGPRSSELRVQDRPLVDVVMQALGTAEPALRACQSGVLAEERCSCPRRLELP